MPNAALRPCLNNRRCRGLTRERYCPTCEQAHRQQTHQAYDANRGTSTQRGYDARWRGYRKWFLGMFPLCGKRPHDAVETKDSRCQQDGRVVAATVVDHIDPVTGPDDPKFYDTDNHQALCERCHNAKRQRESQAVRRG